MEIHISGIEVNALPENARCKKTGENPMRMSKCPILNFDDKGQYCVPELCDEYEEANDDKNTE